MTQISGSAFTAPICFARGRNGDVYGVSGQERGFRWDTVTAQVEQLGITAPSAAPTVTASTANAKYYLAGIDVTDGGFGYEVEPIVKIGGGGSVTISFTAAYSTGTFTSSAHGMANGTAVTLTAITGGAGLTVHATYYVIDTATNTFKLSLTKGGTAVNFTSDVSAGTLRKPVGNPGVAKANLIDGRVASVTLQEYGWGYTTAPTVTCSPPSKTSNKGAGARVEPIVSGYIEEIVPTDPGQDYTEPPDVTVGESSFRDVTSISNGTPAVISHTLGEYIKEGDEIEFISAGTLPTGLSASTSYYAVNVDFGVSCLALECPPPNGSGTFNVATTRGGAPIGTTGAGSGVHAVRKVAPTPVVCYLDSAAKCTAFLPPSGGEGFTSEPTVTVSGGDGTSAEARAKMRYRVVGVRVTSTGSGYAGRPRIVFTGGDGGGAVAEAVANEEGAVVGARLIHGGNYKSPPTAEVVADWGEEPRIASLSPVMRPALRGKYWCAIRYVDNTTEANRGPIPSSISELAELELADNNGSISWGIPTGGIETRVEKIELWRTTADQALVLYKVGDVSKATAVAGAVGGVYTYSDTMSDAELADPTRAGFDALPITLPNGQPNARRFNPPPQNKKVIAIFQDRAWYAVDVPGRTWTGGTDAAAAEPNSIYFSEADEPESVPETNEIIIQENVKGQDRVTALMPFGGGMVVFQERHCYRLTFVSQPLIDSNVNLIGQRGCLNQRCWDTYDNVAYVVDSMGMYVLDGANAVPLSDPVETYWSDNIIHFGSSKWFFVRVDPVTRIVRFFHSVSAGQPDRALCFHPLTKSWWLETYAQTFAAMECMTTGGRQNLIAGGQTGSFYKFDSGSQDISSAGASASIACSIRTGNMAFADEKGSRSIRLLYKPTTADCNLSLGLHYNNSATARAAAVRTDRGTGFTTDGGANATLNLKLTRSALGDATGYAVCSYAGRIDDRSAGTDRHLAVSLSLTRPSGETSILYGAAVEGVTQ